MRVAIMGGTLDPIHKGHLDIAEAVQRELQPQRVLLLPAGDPPHKHRLTDKADRMEMTRIAARDHEGMIASDMEITREKTTYTVDTLRELRAKEPETEWLYIIGADTLDVLDSWREFSEVAKLCVFAVVGRGEERPSEAKMRALSERYGARFEVIGFSGPEISSTRVREAIAAGEDVSAYLPDKVAAYIREKGLYLCGMSFEQVKETLKATLKPGRYTHTIGVAEIAERLAPRFGVDPKRAYLAGLLHDCAKYMPEDEMRASVIGRVDDVDAAELESVPLLHAPAGRVMAEDVFGVRDPQILSAIRKHTLGGAHMTPMEALIYTADFIEPNREDFKGLEQVRALAETDIYAAMRLSTELTRKYVEKRGKQLHPRALEILKNY